MMKVAVVTGASGGIGSETSMLLAEKGYHVVMVYNKSEKAAIDVLKKIESDGGKALAVKCDVSDKEQTDALIKTAVDAFGRVDVLVNNAGVSLQKLFCDVTQEEYNKVFDTNVKGVINCSQSALKYMINQKSGSIVNVSSMWGITGASCEVHYSASKAAVIGLTKALAKELGPSNIRVNCVAPGMIDTKMNACLSEDVFEQIRQETPLCRIGTVKDVAEAILFFCKESSSFVTGQTLSVDGGLVI
ncbi:MAG: SDR family oxidoreductase [Clostridia bacterium]|nr:SDR family oxidoreductase [Clostridia bacterium]